MTGRSRGASSRRQASSAVHSPMRSGRPAPRSIRTAHVSVAATRAAVEDSPRPRDGRSSFGGGRSRAGESCSSKPASGSTATHLALRRGRAAGVHAPSAALRQSAPALGSVRGRAALPGSPMSAELIVRGGTVVTSTGSRIADVAVAGGRIVAVEDRLPQSAEAHEVDASGLLVLPGVVDVHTHTRVASDDEPDRFFQDSVAAAHGGTTTFLSFNNPGTGTEQTGSLPTDITAWRVQTEADSAIDYGLSLVLQPNHADLRREIPIAIDAGVPTFKAFMVYDFALSDEQLQVALGHGRAAGTAQHPLRGSQRTRVEHRPVARRGAHPAALPRPVASAVRRVARDAQGHRDGACRRRADVRRAHVVRGRARRAAQRSRGGRAGVRRDVPALPRARRVTLRNLGRRVRAVRDLAAASLSVDREALWSGLADGTLAQVATDHVPDRLGVEKRLVGSRSPRSATARRASRRCWRSSTARAWLAAGSRSSAWSTCCRRRRRASSG